MANFKTHVAIAAIGLVVPVSFLFLLRKNIYLSILMAVIGMIGGILPDIDSEQSKSKNIIFTMLTVLSFFMVLLCSLVHFNIIRSILLSLGAAILINFVGKKVMSIIFKHRGIIHSIPMAILLSLLLFVLIKILSNNEIVAWFGFLFLVYGFLIHLILDELFAVDLIGRRLKKSFGSALSIISLNNIVGYICLYASIVLVCYFCNITLYSFGNFAGYLYESVISTINTYHLTLS